MMYLRWGWLYILSHTYMLDWSLLFLSCEDSKYWLISPIWYTTFDSCLMLDFVHVINFIIIIITRHFPWHWNRLLRDSYHTLPVHISFTLLWLKSYLFTKSSSELLSFWYHRSFQTSSSVTVFNIFELAVLFWVTYQKADPAQCGASQWLTCIVSACVCRSPDTCESAINDTGVVYQAQIVGHKSKFYPFRCRMKPVIQISYRLDPTLTVMLSLVSHSKQ